MDADDTNAETEAACTPLHTRAPTKRCDADAVRRYLQEVLQNKAFSHADSLRVLLEFTVARALEGRTTALKEYVLGSEVLGRGPRFDPKVDPIVRVQMRRLRERLAHYYTKHGAADPFQISFEKGSYAPVITPRPINQPLGRQCEEPVVHRPYRVAAAVLTAVGLMGCCVYGFFGLHQRVTRFNDVSTRASHARSELDAYEAYTKGRYALAESRVTSVREAVSHFEDAVKKDPSFAPAYSALASCYGTFLLLEMMPPREILPKMIVLSRQAVAIDPAASDAHASLALTLAWEGRMAAAGTEFDTAVRLNGNSPDVHHRFALFLAANGDADRALEHIDRAIALDPMPASHRVGRAVVLYWGRRYTEAMAQAREAVALAPGVSMAHHILGAICLQAGTAAEAVRELSKAAELSQARTFDLGFQGLGYGVAGDRQSARRILSLLIERSQREYVAPLSLALVHLGLGDRSASLKWIQQAYVPGASEWPYFLAAPLYDPIRSEPRFREVVRRIGLGRYRHHDLASTRIAR
jgi:Flp pilus assembly protein TadD